MERAYPATTIANYFIKKASDDEEEITLMKLAKLVYIAHGWYLALFDKPLVSEPVQAWKFGPVIESIYQEFKKFGNEPIDMMAIAQDIPDSDDNTRKLLNRVWEVNKKNTAYQLSNWTHKKGSPWDEIWTKTGGARNQTIPNDLIKHYFLGL
jgi:uncharacterized phage-associated protein